MLTDSILLLLSSISESMPRLITAPTSSRCRHPERWAHHLHIIGREVRGFIGMDRGAGGPEYPRLTI